MQYLGGKTRIAKYIAAEIGKVRRPGQLVWDAFCGGLSVSVALAKDGPVMSTDACAPLIALYRMVQAGWDPPSEVSRETYAAAKALPDSDPMKAFCGFGCSFGGKWFGGYAHDATGKRHRSGRPTNYAHGTRKRLANDVPGRQLELACVDFTLVEPGPCDSAILYLDPPYAGTAGYTGAPPFDYDAFGQRVIEWCEFADVFVSEYDFPLGVCVFEGAQRTMVNAGMSGASLGATERLFYIAKGSL